MIKKLAVAMALVGVQMGAHASGGAWDGIYSCVASAPGMGSNQIYVTINGQPDGRAIFAIAAVSQFNSLYGYGIGQIQAGVFSGTTMYNRAFRFTANGNNFAGTIGIVFGSTTVNASASCTKIW